MAALTNHAFSARLKAAIEQVLGTGGQTELARRLGQKRSGSINRYVNKGRVPDWYILTRIAEELGVSIDWLLTGKVADQTRIDSLSPALRQAVESGRQLDPSGQAALAEAASFYQQCDEELRNSVRTVIKNGLASFHREQYEKRRRARRPPEALEHHPPENLLQCL